MSGYFYTGTEKRCINLKNGIDLTGFIARTGSGSEGVHDPLEIKCIALSDGKEKLIIISCEVLGLSSEFISEVMGLIEERFSVPKDNVLVTCTHTHSGPAVVFLQDCGEVIHEVLEDMRNKILACVETALKCLKPSLLVFKNGICSIGVNRLENSPPSPEGVDEQVGILEIMDSKSGKLDSVIINYACHPVVLGHSNMLFSGDYPHFMEEKVIRHFSDGINVLYTSGCCGDINPKERGNFEVAQKLGFELADCVIRTIDNKEMNALQVSGDFSIESYDIRVPLKDCFSESDAEVCKENYNIDLDDPVMKKIDDAFANWKKKMLHTAIEGLLRNYIDAVVKVVSLGDLTIIALPFEVFHDIGIRLKQHYGMGNTMIFCYTNGFYGYFPSKDSYFRSNYEVKDSYKFFGYPGPISEDAEKILLDAIMNKKEVKT